MLVPETLKELKGLGAELALKIIQKNSFVLAKSPGKDADAAIVNIAKKNQKEMLGLRKASSDIFLYRWLDARWALFRKDSAVFEEGNEQDHEIWNA